LHASQATAIATPTPYATKSQPSNVLPTTSSPTSPSPRHTVCPTSTAIAIAMVAAARTAGRARHISPSTA